MTRDKSPSLFTRYLGKFALNRKALAILVLVIILSLFYFKTKDRIKVVGVLTFSDGSWFLNLSDGIKYRLLITNSIGLGAEKLQGFINETVTVRGEKLGEGTILVFDVFLE